MNVMEKQGFELARKYPNAIWVDVDGYIHPKLERLDKGGGR